jgi:hypothetical protein
MTTLQYLTTFPSAGTALSTSNVGPSAPSQVTKTSVSDTVIAQTSHVPISGYPYAEVTCISGEGATIRCPFNAVSNTAQGDFWFYTSASAPSISDAIATVRYSTNGTPTGPGGIAFKFLWASSGKVIVQDSASTTLAGWASGAAFSPETLPTSSWVRFSWYATGGSTTAGQIHLNMYAGSSSTPINATPFSISTANMTASPLAATDLGRVTATAQAVVWGYFAAAVNDGTTGSELAAYVGAANAIPTITGGATATMTSGTTANITYTGNDSDGTIASFATPTVASSAPTPPTVGTPAYTGIGTASATVTFPITGLSNGDHVFSDTTTDNLGGVSTVGTTRIIYTSTSPMRRSVTLSGVTMTSPSSGTALAALNAWQANPYNATTNPTGVAPPVFVTAGPPGVGAGVTEVYQPYAVGSTPNFYQSWAASDAVTAIPIYVDLKMSGTTYATATATLNSTTPVNVGRACTTSENTAIGTDRSLPSVVSRFS